MADTNLDFGWLPRRWLPVIPPASPALVVRLDIIRWVAALLVCISHVRSICLADYRPETGIFGKIFYFVHGFGHPAVLAFFVLSGYLVGGEILKALKNGTFEWTTYLGKRAARLYAPYLPALLLVLIFDGLGIHFFNTEGLYSNGQPLVMVYYNISARLSPAVFAGNLGFLQTITVPTLGSNTPLWSLANEAWYYLLFPLAATALFAPFGRWRRAVCIGLFISACWVVCGNILLYFGVWLMGMGVHFLRRPVLRSIWPSLGIIAATATLQRLHLTSDWPEWRIDFIFGAATALLVNTLAHKPGAIQASRGVHHRLASFSYSLYLCHWPLALFLVAALRHWSNTGIQMPLTVINLTLYAGILIIVYGFSWSFSLLTERNTAVLRNWIFALFRVPKPPHTWPAVQSSQ